MTGAPYGIAQASHLPPRILEPQEWHLDALCAQTDPDIFFPDKGGDQGGSKHAKALCRQCEVAAECLDYALKHKERWGIWGGLSESERRLLTKGPRR